MELAGNERAVWRNAGPYNHVSCDGKACGRIPCKATSAGFCADSM